MTLQHLDTKEAIRRIAKVIKKRHPNLTVDETLDFAIEILDALEK